GVAAASGGHADAVFANLARAAVRRRQAALRPGGGGPGCYESTTESSRESGPFHHESPSVRSRTRNARSAVLGSRRTTQRWIFRPKLPSDQAAKSNEATAVFRGLNTAETRAWTSSSLSATVRISDRRLSATTLKWRLISSAVSRSIGGSANGGFRRFRDGSGVRE